MFATQARTPVEFGRRKQIPSLRQEGTARRPVSRPEPFMVAGEATRQFLKPGARAFLPRNGLSSGKRLAAVLALTGGIFFGAGAGAQHPNFNQAVDISAAMVGPVVDHMVDVSSRFMNSAATELAATATNFASTATDLASATSELAAAGREALQKTSAELAAATTNLASATTDLAAAGREALQKTSTELAQTIGVMRDQLRPAVVELASFAQDASRTLVAAVAAEIRGSDERHPIEVALAGVEPAAETGPASDVVREIVKEQIVRLASIGPAVPTLTEIGNGLEVPVALVRGVDGFKLHDRGRLRHAGLSEPSIDQIEQRALRHLRHHHQPQPVVTSIRHPVTPVAKRVAHAASPVAQDTYTVVGTDRIHTEVVSSIAHAATITRNDPVYLASLAARESNFRSNETMSTSSASGLFQFLRETWLEVVKTFGPQFGLGQVADQIQVSRHGYQVADPQRRKVILAMRNDPLVSGVLASEMAKRDSLVLQDVLGRAPTPGEQYMSHFFGVSEACRFLVLARNNPNVAAAPYFAKAARANRPVFFARDGAVKSFMQVVAGFKASFEGPQGGMARYATIAQAAASAPAPTSPQYAVLKQAGPQTVKAMTTEVRATPADRILPAEHAALARTPAPAATQTAARPAAPEAPPPVAGAVEKAAPTTIMVRTPYHPGVPASYRVGAGQLASYIDGNGRLSSTATSAGRGMIIEGLGGNFGRLPRGVQDYLRNASQFDLNQLAPYARYLSREARDKLAQQGLTFRDAVAPSGGELVAVAAPKRGPVVAQAAEVHVAKAAPAAKGIEGMSSTAMTVALSISVDDEVTAPAKIVTAKTQGAVPSSTDPRVAAEVREKILSAGHKGFMLDRIELDRAALDSAMRGPDERGPKSILDASNAPANDVADAQAHDEDDVDPVKAELMTPKM